MTAHYSIICVRYIPFIIRIVYREGFTSDRRLHDMASMMMVDADPRDPADIGRRGTTAQRN